jgi:hypothetical protein
MALGNTKMISAGSQASLGVLSNYTENNKKNLENL